MALKELQREQASVKILTMQNNEVSEQWGLSTWTHVTYVGGGGGGGVVEREIGGSELGSRKGQGGRGRGRGEEEEGGRYGSC